MRYITLLLIALSVTSCGKMSPEEVADAIRYNDAHTLKKWIIKGGDPNMHIDGASLLYIATGPKGGIDVIKVLLDAGADPNKGAMKYTPLMNAASWVALDAVKMLIDHGADPLLMNTQGKTALECVGLAGGSEQAVIDYLKFVEAGQQDGRPDAASQRQSP